MNVRALKVYGRHELYDRDRSVTAGRFQLLSDTPSLYVLLDDCEGILRYWKGDFDFLYYLFHLFLYVNNVPFYILFSDPVASSGVGA